THGTEHEILRARVNSHRVLLDVPAAANRAQSGRNGTHLVFNARVGVLLGPAPEHEHSDRQPGNETHDEPVPAPCATGEETETEAHEARTEDDSDEDPRDGRLRLADVGVYLPELVIPAPLLDLGCLGFGLIFL